VNILHLCQDYAWFKGAYNSFETAFPKQNGYLLLTSKPKSKIRHLQYIKDLVLVSSRNLSKLKASFNSYDLIIIHGFNSPTIAELVLKQDRLNKFIWFIMGAEMYHNEFIYNRPLLGAQTKKLADNIVGSNGGIMNILKTTYRFFRYGSLPPTKSRIKKRKRVIAAAIKKIKWIATFQEEQFALLKELKAINCQASLVHFTYYPLEYVMEGHDISKSKLGENILLGNSSSFTNNHIEAIDLLSNKTLQNRKVFVPLSYGNAEYGKLVTSYGEKKLGPLFKPILEFMPLSEYNKVVESCGFVIMNHYRGQAAGNVISSLYKGCKVFMSEKSTIYKYLRNLGCSIYSVESDLRSEAAFTPLIYSEVENNRKLLEEQLSSSRIISSLKEQIPRVLNL
jgi:hypothetical protein